MYPNSVLFISHSNSSIARTSSMGPLYLWTHRGEARIFLYPLEKNFFWSQKLHILFGEKNKMDPSSSEEPGLCFICQASVKTPKKILAETGIVNNHCPSGTKAAEAHVRPSCSIQILLLRFQMGSSTLNLIFHEVSKNVILMVLCEKWLSGTSPYLEDILLRFLMVILMVIMIVGIIFIELDFAWGCQKYIILRVFSWK